MILRCVFLQNKTHSLVVICFSVGVITKHFAVGTSGENLCQLNYSSIFDMYVFLVPWIKGRVGAVATQAETNPLLGIAILELLENGKSAEEALKEVISRDSDNSHRQCHVVDSNGLCASWSGADNVEFASSMSDGSVSVAGNMLHNETVLPAMLQAYQEARSSSLPMVRRIYSALEAGELKGGDKRGPGQSAVILVCHQQPYPVWNIRIDHNEDGTILQEMMKLIEEGEKPYVRNFYDNLPAAFDENIE